MSTTGSVTVTVVQTAAMLAIDETPAGFHAGETRRFTATGTDQFDNELLPASLTWTAAAGTITDGGVYTAPQSATADTVTVACGPLDDSMPLTVTNAAPTIATAAAAVQVPATDTAILSVLGDDDAGESNLTYTWTVLVKPAGAGDPTFSVEGEEGDGSGTHAARNTTATFTALGNYQFQVTVTDGGGLSVTDSVAITVVQTLSAIELTPASASVALGGTEQFTAVGYDQFGDPMATQPAFYFSATAGSIDADGLYTAPNAPLPATVVASSGGVTSLSAPSARRSPALSPLPPGLLASLWRSRCINASVARTGEVAYGCLICPLLAEHCLRRLATLRSLGWISQPHWNA